MNDREKFSLKSDATVEDVRMWWQKLALVYHPDQGGDVENFMQYQRLYKKALKEASVCSTCKGTKRIDVLHGIHAIKINCPDCK